MGGVAAALTTGLAVVPAIAAPAVDHPVPYAGAAAVADQLAAPGSDPPGADIDCMPSAEHPDPGRAVRGLGDNQTINWPTVSPLPADAGYCVHALAYGETLPTIQVGGVASMEESAEELSAFVDEVLDETGAQQVDLVGHSEGTLMPQYYLQFLGGAAKVDDYVAVTPLCNGALARCPSTAWSTRSACATRSPRSWECRAAPARSSSPARPCPTTCRSSSPSAPARSS